MKTTENDNFVEVSLNNLAGDTAKVMAFANRVTVEEIPTKEALASRAETLSAGINTSLHPEGKGPDFGAAIKQLHELRDTKNGILWRENVDDKIIVRDARAQDAPPVNGPEAFQMMALNYARASHVLLEEAKISPAERQTAVAKINEQTLEIFATLAESDNLAKDFKKHNFALLNSLAEGLGVSHESASKQLNVAKDYMNFEDTHAHTVTLSTIQQGGKNYTICEAETMMLGMTDNQKREMNNRKDKEWYREQSPAARSLTDRYAEQIMDGEHTIPTQLRGIPGIRNAYSKTTALAEEGHPLEVVHVGHHSGTVASQAKGGDAAQQRLASQNVEQLAEIVEKPIHMVTLNSPNNPTGNDQAIVAQTGVATGGHHTNLAFNFFRRIVGSNKMDGLNETFTAVSGHATDSGKNAIADYVSGRGTLRAARAELESCDGSDKRMFTAAINATEAIGKNSSITTLFGIFDSENRNLTIASELSIVRHEMRSEEHHGKFDKVPEEVSACQSGKDRNGVKLFNQSAEAVGRALTKKTGQPTDMETLHSTIANAGHTQNQAGNQGGTLGCFGIKKDTKGAIPGGFSAELKDTLVQETASFNGKIKEKVPSLMTRMAKGLSALMPKFGNRRVEEPEYARVRQEVEITVTETLDLSSQSQTRASQPALTADDIGKLPLAERLDQLGKYLDGTAASTNSDRPLLPLVAMNQMSIIPTNMMDTSGELGADGLRALNGAKAWLTTHNADAEKSERIMTQVAEQTPWLVGALATTPAPKGDINPILKYGNTYANVGEAGEFAANYKTEALLLDNVQQRFLTLVKETDPNDPKFNATLKTMQDEILGQVMKSSAFLDYSPKRDAAIAQTIAIEGERNPALRAQFEQEYTPVQQAKPNYTRAVAVLDDKRTNPELRALLGGDEVILSPKERRATLQAIGDATKTAGSMEDVTHHAGADKVQAQGNLATNSQLVKAEDNSVRI